MHPSPPERLHQTTQQRHILGSPFPTPQIRKHALIREAKTVGCPFYRIDLGASRRTYPSFSIRKLYSSCLVFKME